MEQMISKIRLLLNGSIQDIKEIPQTFKNIYKNVWELSNKTLIDMAADRGAFIDQSQSLNLFMAEPDFSKLSSIFMLGVKGLKTGIYYLRTKAVAQAQKFTIDPSKMRKHQIVLMITRLITKYVNLVADKLFFFNYKIILYSYNIIMASESDTVCRRRNVFGYTTYPQPCKPGYKCTPLDRKISVCVKDEKEKNRI